MDSTTVEQDIEEFLYRELQVDGGDSRFSRDVDLFDGGYVDSVGFAELLAFLEERFDVEVPETDLLSEDFASINGIGAVVRRLVHLPT
jgi:acyl carrier protein